MRADPAFSDLIGRVYDCALDVSRWPGVLEELTAIVRGTMAEIAIYNPINNQSEIAAHWGWPDDLLKLVQDNMHLNPIAPLGLVLPLLEPVCKSRDVYMPSEAFHASIYWKKCFANRDHFDYLTTPLTRSTTQFGFWGVSGGRARGPFSDEDIEFARLISPHIRRAVTITGMLKHQQVEAGTLRGALDAISAAAVILAPGGRIMFRNAAAEAELERGSTVQERQGRLTGATPDGIRLVASVTTSSGSPGRDMRLIETEGRVLHASWVALKKVSEAADEPILLLLREPEKELVTPLSAAATLFRLTPTELQVLAQLLHGRTLAEITKILGIAMSTVKTHLNTLFHKTDTARQADLLRVVLGLGSPLQK